jgi:hypothetical protein
VITEDLDLFFADFGVSFAAGAISGMCIKDAPGINILGNQIIEVGHQVIVKSSLFGDLLYNAYVTVAGEAYTVKETMPVEDGAFSLITLEKTAFIDIVTAVFSADVFDVGVFVS